MALVNAQRGKKMFVFLLKYIQDVKTSKTYNYGCKNAKKETGVKPGTFRSEAQNSTNTSIRQLAKLRSQKKNHSYEKTYDPPPSPPQPSTSDCLGNTYVK